MASLQKPDTIAHLLATNEGSPARFYLLNEQATIPITPYRNRGIKTETVSVAYFDAVIERANIDDGGLTLNSFSGIHLPESEWRRIGLEKHWHADDVDLRSPIHSPTRRLELFASREDELYSTSDFDESDYTHLSEIPADSPVLTEWADRAPEDLPPRPPVPLDRPTLSVHTLWAEDATDPRGFDRVEIGDIARIEILDEISEWPTEPDIEPREIDLSPPPRHPEIEYDELEPLSQTETLLQAIFTINRYAKQFGEDADTAYEIDEGAKARAYAIRKRALYRTKTVALHRLVKDNPETVKVVRHNLNDSHEMFCLYIRTNKGGEYSFHQPIDAVESDLLKDIGGHEDREEFPIETISFKASTDTESLNFSLSDAIATLRDRGIDPNDHLDAEIVEDYDWGYEISTTF